MKHVKMMMAAIALSIAAAGPSALSAAEQQLNPKAINITLPDQFQWKRNEAAGNETAVLYGDPDKPGFYVLMFKWLRPYEPSSLASARSYDHGVQGHLVGRYRRQIRS